MMTTPTQDIQSLDPGAIVDMFELDCSGIGGQAAPYRFHAGTNGLGNALVWQGNTYEPWPVQIEGMDKSNKGVLARPTISIANMGGVVSYQLAPLDDLLGAKVTRKRTLAQYLDAANGVPNATPDPNAGWPDEVFYVHQKTVENPTLITWTLVSALDRQELILPRRIIQATICGWNDLAICAYSKGGLCSKRLHVTGPDGKLLATTDQSLMGCTHHWGGADGTGALPFGGFPGSAWIR